MFLVVGLGNPGSKYAGNRHNVGFMLLDRLVERHGFPPWREKFKGHFARGNLGRAEAVCLKPATFMNVSGESVQPAMNFFRVALDQVVVVHDELDLAFGTIRLKQGGGTAGHNGLKSIVGRCGGPNFIRLRIGIGRPQSGAVHGHVLSDFSVQERAELDDVLQRASTALEDALLQGVAAAMNTHNR